MTDDAGAGKDGAEGAATDDPWQWRRCGRRHTGRRGVHRDGWAAEVSWLPAGGCFLVVLAPPGGIPAAAGRAADVEAGKRLATDLVAGRAEGIEAAAC